MYNLKNRNTRKANAVINYMEISNICAGVLEQLRALVGENVYPNLKIKQFDIQAMIDNGEFRKFAGRYSEAKLKEMDDELVRTYRNLVHEKYLKIAESLPEGQKFKDELNDSDNMEQLSISQRIKDHREILRNGVQDILGEDWGLNMSDCHAEIGILDPDAEGSEVRDRFLFGHSFDLYYSSMYDLSDEVKYRMQVNYGTMGSFDPKVDKTRVQLIQGMAEFLNESNDLMNTFNQAFDHIRELRDEYRRNTRKNAEEYNEKMEELVSKLIKDDSVDLFEQPVEAETEVAEEK